MTGSIAKLSAIQTRPLSGPCRAILSQNVLCVTGLARHFFHTSPVSPEPATQAGSLNCCIF
jgi:hypothetical protein